MRVCVFEMRPHCVCDLRLAGIKIEFTTQGNWRVKKLAKGVRQVEVYNLYIHIYIGYIYVHVYGAKGVPRSALITRRIRNVALDLNEYVNVTLALAQQIPIRSD